MSEIQSRLNDPRFAGARWPGRNDRPGPTPSAAFRHTFQKMFPLPRKKS